MFWARSMAKNNDRALYGALYRRYEPFLVLVMGGVSSKFRLGIKKAPLNAGPLSVYVFFFLA